MVGAAGASVLDVVHRRTAPTLALDEVEVMLTVETRGSAHREAVLDELAAPGYASPSRTGSAEAQVQGGQAEILRPADLAPISTTPLRSPVQRLDLAGELDLGALAGTMAGCDNRTA